MRFFPTLNIGILIAASGLFAQRPIPEIQGIPPRATPADYLSQVQAGAVTIAAEFTGHAFPTSPGPLNSEYYVGVEVALF